MNKKIQRLIEPGGKFFLFVMVAFAVATVFFNEKLAIAEGVVIALLVIYSMISAKRKSRAIMAYIESVAYDAETAQNNTLLHFPLPMVVFRLDDSQVVWGNQNFFGICARTSPAFGAKLTDLVPQFSTKWLLEGKSKYPELVKLNERKYQIHGNIIKPSDEAQTQDFTGIAYWVDVTEYDDVKIEYEDSRPVVALIVLDNYDELVKNSSERVRTDLRTMVDDKIAMWTDGKDGFIRRIDRDRYIFIFEQRYLPELVEEKFSLLDIVHDVVSPSGIHATVSIGIGRDGGGYQENLSFASLGIEMALSRGGDQAVIKNRFNFEFFGGRESEIETRTKVKSRVMANALSEFISDASQTLVMGHKYADMDSLGAAAGICCIARKCGKRAKIVINKEKNAVAALMEKLMQEPEYANTFITPQEAMLIADNRSLLVVVDTNRPEQVEDENLLMACNRVAVIDHHRRAASYIRNAALTFHEQYASSVCELMAELLQELVEPGDIMRCEAEAMLAGIMMDTKSFTIRTGDRTFEAAAFLRRAGADTVEVKRLLQSGFSETIAKYQILQRARLYKQSLVVAVMEQPQDRVVAAQAADEMLNISGVEASVVMYPTDEGDVLISARSIGNLNVQVLLEKLGGGGNKSAAGAQLKEINIRDAVNKMFKTIDEYLEE